MSRELAEWRDASLAVPAREEFERSARAVSGYERAHPTGLDDLLRWVHELRAVFGDPPANPVGWSGTDFRL